MKNPTLQNKIHDLWLNSTEEEASHLATILSKGLKVDKYDIYNVLTNLNCFTTIEEYKTEKGIEK